MTNYQNYEKTFPPKGAWYRKDINTITIGASTRSNGAFFSIPFTLVWAGGSMFGIYGSQITSREFDLGTSLFGIPFLIGSVVMIYLCIMQTIGKIEITIEKFNTKTFIGAYDFGFKKTFKTSEIQDVTEGNPNYSYSGQQSNGISYISKSQHIIYTFGTRLNDKHKYYLMLSLKKILKDLNK